MYIEVQKNQESVLSTRAVFDRMSGNEMKITVPIFQRGYVWGKKQWRQLWKDLESIYIKTKNPGQECPQHFMGMLTLDAKNNLLDGQQRLTTVFLLIDCLEALAEVDVSRRTMRPLSNLLSWDDSVENEEKCKEIYNYFVSEIINFDADIVFYKELLAILLDRFFWITDYVEVEDSHRVFEGINATGKEIDFSDFILNFILELNEEKEKGTNVVEIRTEWKQLLGKIYAGGVIPEEFEEEISEEEQKNKPLKLKKFLNALHSVTLPQAEPFEEDIDSFANVFLRLHNSYSRENADWSREELTATYIKEQMILWGNLYVYASTPAVFSKEDVERLFGKVAFEKELYLLSVLSTAKFVPMTMRVLYEYKEGFYDSNDVTAIFGAVNRALLYPEVFSVRTDSNERNSLNKIIYIDRIAFEFKKQCVALINQMEKDASLSEEKKQELKSRFRLTTSGILCFLMGNDLFKEMSLYLEDSKTVEKCVKDYRYNSRFSKAILTLAHDVQATEKNSILNLERSLRKQKERKRTDFEVEHLVAQNIETEGGYSKYGFDSGTIDSFRNLILLEGDLNANAGNNPPSQKIAQWGASVLWEEYKGTIDPRDLKDEVLYAFQQNFRLDQLVDSFAGYMRVKPEFMLLNEIFPFMEVRMKDGAVRKVCSPTSYDAYEVKNGKMASLKKDVLLYYLDKTGNVNDTRDKVIEKEEAQSYYFSCDKTIQQEQIPLKGNSKKREGSVRYIISAFLTCWEKENGLDHMRDFLLQHENEEGDFDKVTDYNARMLHTVGFRERNTVNVSNEVKPYRTNERHDRGQTVEFKHSGVEYNYSFTVEDTIQHLRNIYDMAKLSFPFWVEVRKGRSPFVLEENRGALLVPYFNIGAKKEYREWIRENVILKNKCEGKVNSYKVSPVKSYFRYAEVSLKTILEETLIIPEYQRDYVWEEQNWKELLDEILYCMEHRKKLRLGLVITADSENGKKVVDGQQRLSTIGMFLAEGNSEKKLIRTPALLDEVSVHFSKWYKKESEDAEKIADWLIHNLLFKELIIEKNAPVAYQYHVFTAVNGKGKKLTLEEKVKNYLLSKEYKDKRTEQKICDITLENGFLEPYIEIQFKEDIPRNDLYRMFKKKISSRIKEESMDAIVTEMYEYLVAYKVVTTGHADKNCKLSTLNCEDWMWIRLYSILKNVHTADGLLVEAVRNCLFGRKGIGTKDLIALYKKIDYIYFIMYTMDRSGNDRKSLNAKFPKMIGWKAEDILIRNTKELPATLITESERGVLFNGNSDRSVGEIVWHDYIRNAEIMRLNKEAGRFVLYFIEYWLGLECSVLNKTLEEELEGKDSLIPELEHIYPASRDKEEGTKNLNINCLENCCLLEKSINTSVGDKRLYERSQNEPFRGKLAYYSEKGPIVKRKDKNGKTSTYFDSRFVMPRMFYCEEKDGICLNPDYFEVDEEKKYIFTKKCADLRMEAIWCQIRENGRYIEDIEKLLQKSI